MKKKIFPLLLALCMALSLPVSALSAEDFKGGQLSGIAEAPDGALLVTDVFNKVVWRVADGKVTQYAGAISAAGVSGEPAAVYHDGAIDKAYFMEPWDIVPFLKGYAVSDAAAHVIRYIANDRVYTFCGTGKAGNADGDVKTATFDRPTGLAVDKDGLLYVADAGNGTIRRVDGDGRATTVASGLAEPTALCFSGDTLYVVETGRSRVCSVANGQVRTVAGVSTAAEDSGEYYGGYVDGSAANARFDHPQGIAAAADGTLYVADTGNGAIRAIHDYGSVCTVARGDASNLLPVAPRGLLLKGDVLRAVDRAARDVATFSVADKHYADVVSGAWYVDAVETATHYGIASGTSDTTFEPNGTMNRAMFVTMLSRLYRLGDGAAIIDGDATFSDVEAGQWYAASVRWAADNAVVLGEGGSFAPLRSISRQELVTMLYRYAQSRELSASSPAAALDAYPDAGDTAVWALDAMRWAVDNEIVRGDDQGRLSPAASATRAQALTMLLEFMAAYSL